MKVFVADVTNWQQESRPEVGDGGGRGGVMTCSPSPFSSSADRPGASNHRLCDLASTSPLIGCLFFTALPLLIERRLRG